MTFKKGHKPLGRALKGHITLEKTKEKIREKAIGRISKLRGRNLTEEHKINLKLNHADVSGSKNPMFGKKPGRKNQWRENNPNWRDGVSYKRQQILEKLPKKCNRCGIEDIRVLLVHHKDRNRKNNKIDNFEILCRNCHILEHYNEIFKKGL